jgi:hypothetical protein
MESKPKVGSSREDCPGYLAAILAFVDKKYHHVLDGTEKHASGPFAKVLFAFPGQVAPKLILPRRNTTQCRQEDVLRNRDILPELLRYRPLDSKLRSGRENCRCYLDVIHAFVEEECYHVLGVVDIHALTPTASLGNTE